MTKDQLYDKLMLAYNRHQRKNTLCKTYTDQVIKLVKEYLEYDRAQIEVDELIAEQLAKYVDDLKERPGTVEVLNY